MFIDSSVLFFKQNTSPLSIANEWSRPALASCNILTWIGVYLCFVFIFGIVLNGFVLYALFNNRRPYTPISVFMIALSFSNLMAALLGIPLPLTSNFSCRWLYGKYMCYYEGFIAYFVGMIGLYILTALSLNRYWMIVTPTKAKYVTFQTAYISVFVSVLGGLFWAIAPIFGWNGYTLEGVLTSCSIRWQDRTFNVISYNILMFAFAYIVPLYIMIYCNTKIYLEVRRASKKKLTWRKDITASKTLRKQSREQRMAKTIFFIIVTFVIAWTPYAIVAFISSFFSPHLISPLGGTLPAIFAKSSIYFNPLVYILSSSQINSTLSCRRKKVLKSNESISSRENNERSYSPRVQLVSYSSKKNACLV